MNHFVLPKVPWTSSLTQLWQTVVETLRYISFSFQSYIPSFKHLSIAVQMRKFFINIFFCAFISLFLGFNQEPPGIGPF